MAQFGTDDRRADEVAEKKRVEGVASGRQAALSEAHDAIRALPGASSRC